MPWRYRIGNTGLSWAGLRGYKPFDFRRGARARTLDLWGPFGPSLFHALEEKHG